MQKFAMALTAMLCTSLVAGCSRQPTEPAVDIAKEAQLIKARSAEWEQLYASRDAAAIAKNILMENAVSLVGAHMLHGRVTIQQELEQTFAESKDMFIEWEPAVVQVAGSGDLAYELGSYTMDRDGPGELPAIFGEYLVVWTKVDGSWRVIADSGSVVGINN